MGSHLYIPNKQCTRICNGGGRLTWSGIPRDSFFVETEIRTVSQNYLGEKGKAESQGPIVERNEGTGLREYRKDGIHTHSTERCRGSSRGRKETTVC
jgi:hypothetical protein